MPHSVLKPVKEQANWIRGTKFKWNIMKSILTGISVVDLERLAIENREQAIAYALNYGLDIQKPETFELIQNIHIEALQFIESRFLEDASDIEIPSQVSALEHPLDLLIFASGHGLGKERLIQAWSCAILKVMHCYFQLEHDLKLKNINAIRRQIYRDYESLIVNDKNGIFLRDDQESLPLFFFKFKRNKDRRSIILKLLHKRSHVPSDIYDHLGIRFVLNTRAECLLVLDFLWRHNLINEANIKPSRSKNTLLSLKAARRLFKKYRPELEQTEGYPEEVFKKIDHELAAYRPELKRNDNPFSATDYRSIQITVRKMIQLQEDAIFPLPSTLIRAPRTSQFYFDYEIQLIDKSTWLKTRRGPTSHAAYKKRQVEVARKRVLGPFLVKTYNLGDRS